MDYRIEGLSPGPFRPLFGMSDGVVDAALALPGQAESAIIALFANPVVTAIHAHNAIRGCFAARIERI